VTLSTAPFTSIISPFSLFSLQISHTSLTPLPLAITMSDTSTFANLPTELIIEVVENLPDEQRDALNFGPRRGQLLQRPSLQDLASIAPRGDSRPILKLPFELRRSIYKYLLPDKQKKIEPSRYAGYQAKLRKQRAEASHRRRQAQRARAQQAQQHLLAQGAFFAAPPVNIVPLANPPQPQQQPLMAPGAHLPPLGQVVAQQAAAPAGNQVPAAPLTGNQLVITPAPFTSNQGQAPNTPQTGNPIAQPPVTLNFQTGPAPIAGNAAIFNTPVPPPPATRPANPENDEDLQKALRAGMDDPSPERMTVPLLCVSTQFCSEVAEVLYEEYTFEVHIHSKGIDFLHLPRILTLETYGQEVQNALNFFSPTSKFCFQRMKHVEFVLLGGDPKDRSAAVRIQETVRKLVEMLKQEKDGLREMTIRIALEETEFVTEEGEVNEYWDEIGNFWVNNIEKRARRSILSVQSNVEFVCKPFEELHTEKAALILPVGLEDDFDTNTYKAILESAVTVPKSSIASTKVPAIAEAWTNSAVAAGTVEVQGWKREHEEKLVEVANNYDYAVKYSPVKAAALQQQESAVHSGGSYSHEALEELNRFQRSDLLYMAAMRRCQGNKPEPAPLTEQDFLEDIMDDDDEEDDEDMDAEMEDFEQLFVRLTEQEMEGIDEKLRTIVECPTEFDDLLK
jgi:hypothetical protein